MLAVISNVRRKEFLQVSVQPMNATKAQMDVFLHLEILKILLDNACQNFPLSLPAGSRHPIPHDLLSPLHRLLRKFQKGVKNAGKT